MNAAEASAIVQECLGDVATLPAEKGELLAGPHWAVSPEKQARLGKAARLWVENALQLNLSGTAVYHYAFFGALILTYLPPMMAQIMIWREQRKAKRADPLSRVRGDGQELPSPPAPGDVPAPDRDRPQG